jgi:phosphoribosylanthranilate isomerase
MVKVKLCGVTTQRDATLCIDEGANYLGFIFASISPRRVDVSTVKRIVKALPRSITPVGVFMDHELDDVKAIVTETGVRVAQLHGKESAEFSRRVGVPVIKVFDSFSKRTLSKLPRYDVFAFMLDLPKTGPGPAAIDPKFAVNAKNYGHVFLSGKLGPDNVSDLIRSIQPYGVDCCSATEKSPGKKDRSRVRAFIEAVRRQSDQSDPSNRSRQSGDSAKCGV